MNQFINLEFKKCRECNTQFRNLNSHLEICSYGCQNKIYNKYEETYRAKNIDSENLITINYFYLKHY